MKLTVLICSVPGSPLEALSPDQPKVCCCFYFLKLVYNTDNIYVNVFFILCGADRRRRRFPYTCRQQGPLQGSSSSLWHFELVRV